MSRLGPQNKGGAGGVAFILCLSAALFGLGFDLMRRNPDPFWIGASPGGAAAIGAAAALFCLAAARIAPMVLRRDRSER